MPKFEEKKFDIKELKGISKKNIEEHLKLYSGYVKNANSVVEKISELNKDVAKPSANADGRPTPAELEFREKNMYLIGELSRRFSFEYNGMRNHEVFFDSLSGGFTALTTGSPLEKKIIETCRSVEILLFGLKNLAMTRGPGWAVLWYDKKDGRLLASWVDEHHLGQLNNCAMILALDMWEHAFVTDYQPSGKKQYIEDFLTNLNWKKIEANFEKATS